MYANWRKNGFEAEQIAKRFTDFQKQLGWENIEDIAADYPALTVDDLEAIKAELEK